jgi:hypothetical protein
MIEGKRNNMSRAKDMGVISQKEEKNEKNVWKTIPNKNEWVQKEIEQRAHFNYHEC